MNATQAPTLVEQAPSCSLPATSTRWSVPRGSRTLSRRQSAALTRKASFYRLICTAAAGTTRCGNLCFEPFSDLKTIRLPRQAQDKHKEPLKNKGVFLQVTASAAVSDDRKMVVVRVHSNSTTPVTVQLKLPQLRLAAGTAASSSSGNGSGAKVNATLLAAPSLWSVNTPAAQSVVVPRPLGATPLMF
jgi:hypothetical protein